MEPAPKNKVTLKRCIDNARETLQDAEKAWQSCVLAEIGEKCLDIFNDAKNVFEHINDQFEGVHYPGCRIYAPNDEEGRLFTIAFNWWEEGWTWRQGGTMDECFKGSLLYESGSWPSTIEGEKLANNYLRLLTYHTVRQLHSHLTSEKGMDLVSLEIIYDHVLKME